MLSLIYGITASIGIVVGYIPQLRQTYVTKDVSGQNVSFWAILTYSLSYLLYSAILSGDSMLIIAQSVNFISALAMLIMVVKYGRND